MGFADLARAILASDEASHPDSRAQREWLVDEFVKRGIAHCRSELGIETNYPHPALQDVDLQGLLDSDWRAYRFAERWRDLFGMPPEVPFEVRPRQKLTKTYYHRGDQTAQVTECLFKVSWEETEACEAGDGLPVRRRIARGSTLAIDWDRKIVRAVVRGSGGSALRRDALLLRLVARGQLALGADAQAPDGVPRRGVVRGDVRADGALHLSGTARLLHMMGGR